MNSNQHQMEINNIDDNKNKFPATNASHSLPLMVSLAHAFYSKCLISLMYDSTKVQAVSVK